MVWELEGGRQLGMILYSHGVLFCLSICEAGGFPVDGRARFVWAGMKGCGRGKRDTCVVGWGDDSNTAVLHA